MCLQATASVDYETDRRIQQSTRVMFQGTLITIAHRLHTVMQADCIVVLEAGRVAEYGPPSKLVNVAGGALQQLVDGNGPEEAAALRAIALHK